MPRKSQRSPKNRSRKSRRRITRIRTFVCRKRRSRKSRISRKNRKGVARPEAARNPNNPRRAAAKVAIRTSICRKNRLKHLVVLSVSRTSARSRQQRIDRGALPVMHRGKRRLGVYCTFFYRKNQMLNNQLYNVIPYNVSNMPSLSSSNDSTVHE